MILAAVLAAFLLGLAVEFALVIHQQHRLVQEEAAFWAELRADGAKAFFDWEQEMGW